MHMSEELDGAARRRDGPEVLRLLEADVSRAEHRELPYSNLARGRKHQHAARLLPAQILRLDRQPLGLDEAAHELVVARPDVGELGEDSAAAEELHPEPCLARAAREQRVDQALHREHSIAVTARDRTALRVTGSAVGEQEVIHAA